jgi:heme-degrading monooxygenase HmoA
MTETAVTPAPPYYAVIFTSIRSPIDGGYSTTSQRMIDLAKEQKGFLGFESAREHLGITVSYWKTEEDIVNWKNNAEHLFAQKKGNEEWYQEYKVRICKVERDYFFTK